MTTCLVVMGVSGAGKTTVATALADRLGWPMAEADEFHPAANIAKMSAGVPLTDADRVPWLLLLRDWIAKQDKEGKNTIVTCSALKRSYRDLLSEAPGRVRFVHLNGSREVIASRLKTRSGHFMPPGLLDSQLASLEPLDPDEDGITVDIAAAAAQVIDTIADELGLAGSAG